MLGLNYLAWLGILVWVVVPAFAWLTAWLIRRRAQTTWMRGMGVVVGLAILSAPWLISSGVKAHYDRQVRELCAKDGGVRVYETVRLPPERFNQWGQLNFRIPVTPYKNLNDIDEYYLKWETTSLKHGNPELERSHFRLFRRSDNKLLGESVTYMRRDGDLPGPWHGSSFACPEPGKRQSLESSIFAKGDKQ